MADEITRRLSKSGGISFVKRAVGGRYAPPSLVTSSSRSRSLVDDPKRQLTLLYLANDVVQTGRAKAPEYLPSFESVLSEAFQQAAR